MLVGGMTRSGDAIIMPPLRLSLHGGLQRFFGCIETLHGHCRADRKERFARIRACLGLVCIVRHRSGAVRIADIPRSGSVRDPSRAL